LLLSNPQDNARLTTFDCQMRELSLDPYYYLLHISIDNSDTGHARIAIDTGMNAWCVRAVRREADRCVVQ
jgi:hypothetical protein